MEGEETDEILALVAIYEDKLRINESEEGKTILTTIYPATAEDETSQYVCLELSISLSRKYPVLSPDIKFLQSRGLSDSTLDGLMKKMLKIVKERRGECVLFDLLDFAKETLTSNNIPSCLCSICLSGFEEGDEFLKTDCFHYFHCYCLKNYHCHVQSELGNSSIKKDISTATVPCPICKLPVALDLMKIGRAKSPVDSAVELEKNVVNNHINKFKKAFEKQLRNGGLIDLEYEQNKFLLSNIQQAYESHIASQSQDGVKEDQGTSEDENKKLGKSQPHGAKNHHKKQETSGQNGLLVLENKINEIHQNNSSTKSKAQDNCNGEYKSKPRWQHKGYRGGYKTNPKPHMTNNSQDLRRSKEAGISRHTGLNYIDCKPGSRTQRKTTVKVGNSVDAPSVNGMSKGRKQTNFSVDNTRENYARRNGQIICPRNRPRGAVGSYGHRKFEKVHHKNVAPTHAISVETEHKFADFNSDENTK